MATNINQFTRPFTAGSMPTFARLVRGCLILLALISSVAQASEVTGKITKIAPLNDQDVWYVYFETSTIVGTPPACAAATVSLKRYGVKTSTTTGKAIIASLLVAFQSGKTVNVAGRGNFGTAATFCDAAGDAETIYYAVITAN